MGQVRGAGGGIFGRVDVQFLENYTYNLNKKKTVIMGF